MSKVKATPSARKLTIQIGVCRRMAKEAAYYVKEVADNTAKNQKMRDEGKDPYDIQKQEEVLAESVMMVPDSRRRLGEAIDKLEEMLQEEEGVGETEVAEEARTVVRAFREEQEQEQAGK